MTRAAVALLLVGAVGGVAPAQTPFDPPRPRSADPAELAGEEARPAAPAPSSPVAASDPEPWTIAPTFDDDRASEDLRGIYGLADLAARSWCMYRGTLRRDRALAPPYRR